jgi:hypothetical protein
MEVLSERTFSSEEKRRALDLVLQSETFSRADQLRKFLRYICEMEASGHLDAGYHRRNCNFFLPPGLAEGRLVA